MPHQTEAPPEAEQHVHSEAEVPHHAEDHPETEVPHQAQAKKTQQDIRKYGLPWRAAGLLTIHTEDKDQEGFKKRISFEESKERLHGGHAPHAKAEGTAVGVIQESYGIQEHFIHDAHDAAAGDSLIATKVSADQDQIVEDEGEAQCDQDQIHNSEPEVHCHLRHVQRKQCTETASKPNGTCIETGIVVPSGSIRTGQES